jgi:soluble lytic murein transglycosylase-like protein
MLRAPGAACRRSDIEAAAGRHGLNPNLVEAVVLVSSGGRPEPAGRSGRWGLMGAPAGLRPESGTPADGGLDAGCRRLAECARTTGHLARLALAAWREGPGEVRRWMDSAPQLSEAELVGACASDSTAEFIERVLAEWSIIEMGGAPRGRSM